MGKGKFDKKQAVRFTLIPGPEKDGKPSVLFKPVDAERKNRLSKKQRKNIITELSDYDQITINGKPVNENEIPAFVLEQIRGRKDLVFNQKREEVKQEQVGDLYDIQDVKCADDDDEFEEYEDYSDEEHLAKVEEDGEDWEDQDDEDEDEEEIIEEEIIEKVEEVKDYVHKAEDFPVIEEKQDVEVDGITYSLTKAQAKLLETIIPENYESFDFGGLDFKKYNEDGLLLSDKAKYEKYFLKEDEQVVVIDTYEYVPLKPLAIDDNDYKPSQINGNVNLKEVEQALNQKNEEEAYEELEDDFFSKMISMELEENAKQKGKEKKIGKTAKASEKEKVPQTHQEHEKNKKEVSKKAPKQQPVKAEQTEKQLDQQLDKALFNFQHNIEEQTNQIQLDEQDNDEEIDRNFSMNFTDLQKRQEYIGRDGELDWRNLTKKEKRQYMKTKVIRQYYDELREREIEQKMKGINNVTPEELHLKTLIKHIPYEEDHVMIRALEEDLNKKVDIQAEDEDEDYSSMSQEDDIVSFHQKTSIIASNLSVIEQPRKKRAPQVKEDKGDANEQENSRIKVVPEKRDKNQTTEQRKERKEKLRAQKKEKKEQKKQFAEQFSKIRKDFKKKQNTTNPLNKVSYVKIH